jgi:hypothetical protein
VGVGLRHGQVEEACQHGEATCVWGVGGLAPSGR